MTEPEIVVRGAVVDAQTRCVHYRTALDVVALRFGCCGDYWPCHLCHAEGAGHPEQPWPRSRFHESAVLCGVCQSTMTVAEYQSTSRCPHCDAAFNPGCSAHAHLYFEDGGCAPA
ncbi:CHY zinc finger protein [Citricoccus sp. NR2]|uniref:CHY zinc finger protein n=1 Tax=Citricoccus sp. NR2 TaxID=3004095 RepID=UPI0022DDB70D|nr:CHY zinc finger protein [Citricoccus sp. NR2]WBL18074.1 CHY zinc finger protein [Citricoccus sp. NR2]